MKKLKMFFVFLFMMGITTTVMSADSINLGHNYYSKKWLQNGYATTLCTDTSSSHSYWTIGVANNTTNARIATYIRNASGITVASKSSSNHSVHSIANWTRSNKTAHYHAAASGLIY